MLFLFTFYSTPYLTCDFIALDTSLFVLLPLTQLYFQEAVARSKITLVTYSIVKPESI